ncbi:MAG TPA: enoyl-CoA hydratase/isomerase family protein [Allosphingosinicella sp.]|nr:enoyl-CoA hydratase/isomerase family protein [Allosphingosinicella sp.]
MFELRIENEVARITLRREEARNAVPLAGWDALAERVKEAQGARLLIVAGGVQAFSAGADLGDFAAMSGDLAAASGFREAMRRGIEAVAMLPIPTIAIVEGPCYGAGVALALACDLRLAGPHARFAITPAKIGISYPQEDVFRLVALVGPAQAAKLLYTAASIDAEEALRIGLADSRGDELDMLAAALLASDGASIATLKRGIALAGQGVASDPRQDKTFDALIAAPAVAERLAARKAR